MEFLADVKIPIMKILIIYVLNVTEIVLPAARQEKVLVILVKLMPQKQKLGLELVLVILDGMKIQIMSVNLATPLVLDAQVQP